MEGLLVMGMMLAATLSLGGIAYALGRGTRQNARLLHKLRQSAPLLYHDPPYQLCQYRLIEPTLTPPPTNVRWHSALLTVTAQRVALYQGNVEQVNILFGSTPDQLIGFWRPEKYNPALNEIWLHLNTGKAWYILQIRLYQGEMQALVRALKQIATEEQIIAYRRHRPYLHRGLSIAYPATQNLQGAWVLGEPVQLYLLPSHVVIFEEREPLRLIPIGDIQEISALKRLDAPSADGLLRFRVRSAEETLAFALPDYEVWAREVAEAAKRTLEDPILRKTKSKIDE
jgi:hypothetical protein